MKKMAIAYISLILMISCGVKKNNNISKDSFISKSNLIQQPYRYIRWFRLHPENGLTISVKIYQDTLYNLFLEVYDSSKRRVYGSSAAMMSDIDTTNGAIKEYYFNQNQKLPTYVISTYEIGSTYGKTGLFFIWNNGNSWQVRSDGLNRATIEHSNNGVPEIVDSYPDQQQHFYKFQNGNIIPLGKE